MRQMRQNPDRLPASVGAGVAILLLSSHPNDEVPACRNFDLKRSVISTRTRKGAETVSFEPLAEAIEHLNLACALFARERQHETQCIAFRKGPFSVVDYFSSSV